MEILPLFFSLLICAIIFYSFYNPDKDDLFKFAIFIFVLMVGTVSFNTLVNEIDVHYHSYQLIVLFGSIFLILERNESYLKHRHEKYEMYLVYLESLGLGYLVSILILPMFDSLYWFKTYGNPVPLEFLHSLIAMTISLVIYEIILEISIFFYLRCNPGEYRIAKRYIKSEIRNLFHNINYRYIKRCLGVVLVVVLIPFVFTNMPIHRLSRQLPDYYWHGKVISNHPMYYHFHPSRKDVIYPGNYYLKHEPRVFTVSTLSRYGRLNIHNNILYINLRNSKYKPYRRYGILHLRLYQAYTRSHKPSVYYFKGTKNILIYNKQHRKITIRSHFKILLYRGKKIV